ncbi:hypothetical protein LTR66_003383 [Elasticomyces elasticus]|nr:hypothetical protein LTR50_002624 [Elasticomyces elasticus]KAK4997159.1 hypothetical protein LTR66_003383 [Elasticomyces elasticus]
MAPLNLQHRRTHNLLLISKLLNQRETTSPFTLISDTLAQSAKPLVAEYTRRANIAKTNTVYLSFETLRRPHGVNAFVLAWDTPLRSWQKEVANHVKPTAASQRTLLIIDSLTQLVALPDINLPALLSSFITPTTSLLAVYHTDIPVPASKSSPYSPTPLTLLSYLATALISVHSLHHVLARKSARDRSLAGPVFGLEEGVEGVLQGLGSNDERGLVIEVEYRRKSGRGIKEWYFLPSLSARNATAAKPATKPKEPVILLEDHPLYHRALEDVTRSGASDESMDTTFDLGLTEKQRRDREGVVLPYFDAQKGGGEGGRILYDMGAEDDFDEEEDEI